MLFNNLSSILPKYLTPQTEKELFSEIKRFLDKNDNIDSRLYTNRLQSARNVFQGDGLNDLLYVDLSSPHDIHKIPCMIVSNTCDINVRNERFYQPRILYAPILNMEKYILILEQSVDRDKINDHVLAIKDQMVSSVFYLPKGGALEYDGVVYFDRLINCDTGFIDVDKICNQRIFSLSQFGHYLFIVKLSIHFTRIFEDIDRDSPQAEQFS